MLWPVYTHQMYMWACILQVFAALKTIFFHIFAFSHQQKIRTCSPFSKITWTTSSHFLKTTSSPARQIELSLSTLFASCVFLATSKTTLTWHYISAAMAPSRSQIKFKHYNCNGLVNKMNLKKHCLQGKSRVHCVIAYSRGSMLSKKRVTMVQCFLSGITAWKSGLAVIPRLSVLIICLEMTEFSTF